MNESALSRTLSTSIVEALKSQGHILVVKGGAVALARELEDLLAPSLASILPRLKPKAPMGAEPTSTFGDEAVDEAVEEAVTVLTRALMDSEHVEDVFTEDNVIRRDVFRVLRDGLLDRTTGSATDEETTVQVRLDALGYVAATVSKRARPEVLREALRRAADLSEAHFTGFQPDAREATFRLIGAGPDERLELEEAVADELADLIDQGLVDLPKIERRVDLGRPLTPAEQRALRPEIESAADATLYQSTCAAAWDFADFRTIRITFTPLSERDAEGLDAPMSAFARELGALLAAAPSEDYGNDSPKAPKAPVAPQIEQAAFDETSHEEEAPEAIAKEGLEAAPKQGRAGTTRKASAGPTQAKKTVAKKAATKKAEPVERTTPAAADEADGGTTAKRTKSAGTKSTKTTAKTKAKKT